MATKKSKQPKSYNYILVLTSEGPKFVTGFGERKTAFWDEKEAPYLMDLDYAREVAFGLTVNGCVAFPVSSKFEIDKQPYFYDKGHFEWKWDDNKEEN